MARLVLHKITINRQSMKNGRTDFVHLPSKDVALGYVWDPAQTLWGDSPIDQIPTGLTCPTSSDHA